MGCFNGTCEISHLPIRGGDKVVFIPLVHHTEKYMTHNYYADNICSPFGFPIVGYYNEYGGIENFKLSDANREFFKTTTFSYLENDDDIPVNERQYHTCKFEDFQDDETFIQEVFCGDEDCCIPNRSSISTSSKYCGLTFFMVHYELYQMLMQNMKARKPYGETRTIEKCYLDKFEKEIQNAFALFKKMKIEMEEVKEKEFSDIKNHDEFELVFGYPMLRQRLSDTLFKIVLSKSSSYMQDMVTVLLDNPELYDEILRGACDIGMFSLVLDQMRCGFGCQCGLGSQSEETGLHMIMAEFIQKHVLQMMQDDECEEDAKSNNQNGTETTLYYFD